MKIFVQAKPNSKVDKIIKIDKTHFEIFVKAPPIKGLANQAIIELLAQYFNIGKTKIKIISGWSSRQKQIEIN